MRDVMVRSRTARPVRPRHLILPEPGARLREGIETVLRELDQPVVDDVNRLTGTLRGCLAYTAARGETCQVSGPAEAARIAAHDLSMGRLDDARLALTQALGMFGR